MYTEESIYITGSARSSKENYISKKYGNLAVSFVVDPINDKILDVEFRVSMEITNNFFKHLLINKNILDEERNIEEMKNRYFGESVKAFIVCYKNALQNYKNIKK
nr:DUF3870 domain-containing protein [uncultured Cetobacterium sp.]